MMSERDFGALDGYPLLPRVLHEVASPDLRTAVLGWTLPSPMVPRLRRPGNADAGVLAVMDADVALDPNSRHAPAATVAVLGPSRMAELVPRTRALAELAVAAIGLDFSAMADSEPFGQAPWRPRTREDLAELRAAAGRPMWVFGLCDATDAEVAAEAGVDAVVLGCEVGRRVGAPAVIDVLPEVLDAVAGMLTVAVAGPVRDGIDVFRYLAVGAELVVVDGDRSLEALEAELAYAMRLTGCASLADVGYDALFAPLFGEP
jgi:isopentenyl diphosphate isomerase/L-lactate dehydrogenase-like FMN-dependent dehydrogenase